MDRLPIKSGINLTQKTREENLKRSIYETNSVNVKLFLSIQWFDLSVFIYKSFNIIIGGDERSRTNL